MQGIEPEWYREQIADLGFSFLLSSFPQDKLSKNVNMRAMNMLGKAEEKVSECGFGCLALYFAFESSTFSYI